MPRTVNERLANLGYLLMGKESVPGVAVTPAIAVPMYEESMDTMANFVKLNPIVGHKFATNKTIQGLRTHGGDLTIMAEGNSCGHVNNALLTKGSTTGSNPYSTAFTAGLLTGSYTYDISIGGNLVKRFWGVQLDNLEPAWNENEMQYKMSAAALGSFAGREIASVTTTTITLKTDYDPRPTKGLVQNDLVRIYKESDGSKLDTTISTINADGITLILGNSAASFAAGDMIYLRAVTPTYDNLAPFTWANTYVGFGANYAAALANATAALQTRVEQGSTWKLIHDFEKKEGAQRSGGFDPEKLVRTLVDGELTIKRVFDGPEDVRDFNSVVKTACVFRHLAGASNQYEFRVGFHNLTTDTPLPKLKSKEIAYSEIKYILNQDATDGAAIETLVVGALATI